MCLASRAGSRSRPCCRRCRIGGQSAAFLDTRRPRRARIAPMQRPLEGIRVLDLTIWQQGTVRDGDARRPRRGRHQDRGARVRRSRPLRLDEPGARPQQLLRGAQPRQALDRARPQAPAGPRRCFLRLAATADVFVNNFRIGAIERLGLDYDAMAAVNPRIVYVQASGYGPRGPDADVGAFDFLAQARGGFASTNGEPDDPPMPTQVPIADQVGRAARGDRRARPASSAATRTGRGCKLDTSLLGSQISLQSFDITTLSVHATSCGRAPYRGGSRPFWRDVSRRRRQVVRHRHAARPRVDGGLQRHRPAGAGRRRALRHVHRARRRRTPRRSSRSSTRCSATATAREWVERAQRHRHVRGAGAGLRRGRGRPAGDRERLHPRGRAPGPRPRAHCRASASPSTASRCRSRTSRRSSASTPRRCCSKPDTRGTRSAQLRRGGVIGPTRASDANGGAT